MGYEQVMIWPYTEKISIQSCADVDCQWLEMMKQCVEMAQQNGFECWITVPVNIGPIETGTDFNQPVKERVFFKDLKIYWLDDKVQKQDNLKRLEYLISKLNNADGYVFIDTDPGSYPGAKAEDYVDTLRMIPEIIRKHGTHPERQKVIPWLWGGWGNAGENATFGGWNKDLKPYLEPVLDLLKNKPLPEPYELLPGRSHLDLPANAGGHANGRINLELIEEKGLLEKSTLFTYEIIEFEPCCPAFVPQFDIIRDVLKRESHSATQARGIFGNAQQPVDALQNMFFFAKATLNFDYLDTSNREILIDFSNFLGGNPELLVPAINCLNLDLHDIPSNLPEKLRSTSLQSEAASLIPGGPEKYLDILAYFVEARISVLNTVARNPANKNEISALTKDTMNALVNWWKQHRYTGTGIDETGYDDRFTDHRLIEPFKKWKHKYNRSNI